MSKVAQLAAKFSREGEKALGFFSQLPDEAWEIQLYADGAQWSVKEVLAHIVETEISLRRLFENIRDGGNGITNKIDIDHYNAKAIAKLKDIAQQELLGEFRSRREKMIEFVSSLSEEDLSLEGNHPFLGEATLEEMLRLFYLHVNLHIRDIRAVLN